MVWRLPTLSLCEEGEKIEHESRKELKSNNKTSNLGSTDLKELTDLTECWHLYCFSKFRLTGEINLNKKRGGGIEIKAYW